MSNNIKLKDLVWKEKGAVEELLKELANKWYDIYNTTHYGFNEFLIRNAEQIAKEKAEILNKEEQYTKQDIIDMFVEAGFESLQNHERLEYRCNKKIILVIEFIDKQYNELRYTIRKEDDSNVSIFISLNDGKSIEFYYNKFREILEFEVNNEGN